MKGYDTASYASSRLDGTIIRKGNTPIMVQSCDTGFEGIIVNWKNIIGSGNGQDYLHDLNLDPAPLGYVNHEGRVVYMTRMPMRQDWKQGMRDRNIVDSNGFNSELPYKAIGRTILGDFPSFIECLARVSGSNYAASAFDRNFTLIRGGKLGYKGLFEVGKVNLDNGAVNIDDSYSWVREAFEETMEQAA